MMPFIHGIYGSSASFIGAYDNIPTLEIWDVRRVLSSYTGPLVTVLRDSDDVTQDFGYDADGHLDTAAIATFLGGAAGYLRKLYGQKNGIHLEQTTKASMPLYVASIQNGRPGVRFDGTDDFMVTAAVIDLTGSLSGLFVGEVSVRKNFNGLMRIAIDLAAAVSDFEFYTGSGGTGIGPMTAIEKRGGTSHFIQDNSSTPALGVWHADSVILDGDAPDLRQYLNKYIRAEGTASGTPSALSVTDKRLWLGVRATGAGQGLNGDMSSLVLADSDWSVADWAAAVRAANDYYNLFYWGAIPDDYTAVFASTTIFDAFGFAVVAANGDVLWIGRRGTDHVGDNGKIIKFVYSSGAWGTAVDVVDDATYDDRCAGGGIAPSTGTLLFFRRRYDHIGATNIDIDVYRSIDNGDTWNNVATIDTGADPSFASFCPLVELPSGKLMMTFYGTSGTTYRVYVQFSEDDGLTWGNEVVIATGTSPQATETAVCYLSGATDGAAVLLAVARDNNGTLKQFSSTNGGGSWAVDGAVAVSQGTGTDLSPWLYVDGGTVYLIWADRLDDKLYWSSADIADVAGNPSAWSAKVSVWNAVNSSNFGYPSIVKVGGNLHVCFNDRNQGGSGDVNVQSSLPMVAVA